MQRSVSLNAKLCSQPSGVGTQHHSYNFVSLLLRFWLWMTSLRCPLSVFNISWYRQYLFGAVFWVWLLSMKAFTEMILCWVFSILLPWWTWERSYTSMGNFRMLKQITSGPFSWNPMTPSLSPTCVSYGTSWRNRAWGLPDRELNLLTALSCQVPVKRRNMCLSDICSCHPGRWKSQWSRLFRGTSTNLLSLPQAKSTVHSLAGVTHYLDSLRLSSSLALSQEPQFSLFLL